MKTLILNGTTRKKGDADFIVNKIKDKLSGEIMEVSFFDDISPCLDCRYCWENEGCVIDDKMQEVYRFIEDCDNVILVSPIWFSEITGPLLNITSRFQRYYTSKYFRGIIPNIKEKDGVIMLVGGESGTETNAIFTAKTVLGHINATPVNEVIMSLDTNNVPASEDIDIIGKIGEAVEKMNEKAFSCKNDV